MSALVVLIGVCDDVRQETRGKYVLLVFYNFGFPCFRSAI